MIKIKRDDQSHSHGKYEVKLRPMPWENVLCQIQTERILSLDALVF